MNHKLPTAVELANLAALLAIRDGIDCAAPDVVGAWDTPENLTIEALEFWYVACETLDNDAIP